MWSTIEERCQRPYRYWSGCNGINQRSRPVSDMSRAIRKRAYPDDALLRAVVIHEFKPKDDRNEWIDK